jgi:hypothetical protein
VQFELDFRDEESSRQFFTVQLAPLEYMPVSVYTFLQQVSKNLWDDSAFYVKAPHVLMASRGNSNDDEEVDHVPFEEYSDQYPHKQYTLGFSGHPVVSPDWYINTLDNSENHGPRGPLGTGAEPCFGEIIIGRETIDKATSLPVREGALLENPVVIASARLVDSLEDVVGGEEYLNQQR